jgi:hypothetical protein
MIHRPRIGLLVLATLGLAALALWRLRSSASWFEGNGGKGVPHADLDEEGVNLVLELKRIGGDYRYDPLAYLQMTPEREQDEAWPEHPSGRIHFRTNNLGFRRAEPTLAEKRGLRILVAGDSQVAGPVHDEETFTHLLEARLRAQPGRESLEVINAGVPYTGPYCYLGVLRKHLALAPDVFIAVFYTGNDLWDDLKVRCYLDGTPRTWPDGEYRRRVTEATGRAPAPMQQGMNQAMRWKTFPAEAESALAMVIDSFTRMQALCAEHGIRFLALVLPTKMDVEPEDDAATQADALETLGLSASEAGINRVLGRRFAMAMEAAGIRCLDPLEDMRKARHPLYWRQDYHLGPAGHALLAELLERVLDAWLRSVESSG